MKKTLRIVLLATVALAALGLLTGCDEMLRSLFPDQTGQTTGGNNTVTFNIDGEDYLYNYNYSSGYGVSPGYWNYYEYSWYGGYAAAPVFVRMWHQDSESGDWEIWAESSVYFTDQNPGTQYRSTSATFTGVPDGQWQFEVWYDYNGDNDPTNEASDNYWDYYTQYDQSYNYTFFVSSGATQTVNINLHESYYSYMLP